MPLLIKELILELYHLLRLIHTTNHNDVEAWNKKTLQVLIISSTYLFLDFVSAGVMSSLQTGIKKEFRLWQINADCNMSTAVHVNLNYWLTLCITWQPVRGVPCLSATQVW